MGPRGDKVIRATRVTACSCRRSRSWPVGARAGLGGLLALLFGMSAWGAESVHTVPYVPSASSEGHAGLVRLESGSAVSGEVRVVAVDDAGRKVEAGSLTLGTRAAMEFEMSAMESGDAALGLAGTGSGEGDWRLELTTELEIEARAYARSEGLLTALHDAALVTGEVEFPLFNPGGEAGRRSVLRLANAGGEPATVAVRGVDDAGGSGGPATVELGAWEARSYMADELESGSAAGLSGSLGDGEGKWRLLLSAEGGSAYATNLLLDASGVLSSVPGGISRGGFHRVSLFPSASDGSGRRGVVRVVNRSAATAEVEIDAFDATDRAYERLRLSLGGESSAELDSADLEQGNAEKDLTGSTGLGEGDWWLELASGSDIEVLSYVAAASGPLSALRGTAGAETDTGMRYEAVLLAGEAGELRLLNAGGETVEVRVSATDDAGASGGQAELTLAPWVARTVTATELEEGGEGLRGALGVGTGSWRLRLESDREIDVLSLVRGTGGVLSDVSRRVRPAGAPPRTDVIDATASRSEADLWVSASASGRDLSPGEAFELRATVGNIGDLETSATTLRYYRSADAAITTGDTELGTDAVNALAASGTSSESIALTAPSTVGTYYYGACADAVAGESDPSNNCSAAVAVTVREPPAQPDLEATASLSVSAVAPAGAFELFAAVRNRGGAEAQATTLRYYRSTDAAITIADTEVGTDAVDALAASGSSAESIALTAPSTSGTYYYGACVDAVPDESDVANNCSMGVGVAVAGPPDLVVSASSSDVGRDPGCNSRSPAMNTSATVQNVGAGDAPSTTLRYFRSSDATVSADDAELGSVVVPPIAASGRWSRDLESDPVSGTHYYYACADSAAIEVARTNNCSDPQPIATSALTPPDLKVTNLRVVVDGSLVRMAVSVRNVGDREITGHRNYICRSTNRELTHCEVISAYNGSEEAGGYQRFLLRGCGLTNGGGSHRRLQGTFYYRTCVEEVTPEDANPENDCSQVIEVVQ